MKFLALFSLVLALFLQVSLAHAQDGDEDSNPTQPTTYPGVCSVNGKEKLWAQKRVNADLLLNFVRSQNLIGNAFVAETIVMDSGFDRRQLGNMVEGSRLRIEPGVFGNMNGTSPVLNDPRSSQANQAPSLVADAAHDAAGHGTKVASLIGGAGGVGVAPHANLRVLRVAPVDDPIKAGSAPSDFIDYGIEYACTIGSQEDPQGVTVINASWGDRRDESGTRELEQRKPGLIRYLQNKGCLLIEAAGNSSFEKSDSLTLSDGSDDPVVRISATQSFGELAHFSSTGVLSAPGESVYALASSVANASSKDFYFNTCESSDFPGKPEAFVNGTSFASPIAAGVASEIVSILKARHGSAFSQLGPYQRMVLVKRILFASQVLGVVDALRAGAMAANWQEGSFPNVSALQQSLTYLNAGCDQNSSNVDTLRQQLSLCVQWDNGQKINSLVRLASASMKSHYFESAAGFINQIFAYDPQNGKAYSLVEDYIRNYISSISGDSDGNEDAQIHGALKTYRLWMTGNLLHRFIPAHLQNQRGRSSALLEAALSSYSVQSYMDKGPGRGSEGMLQSIKDNLALYQNLAGSGALRNLVQRVLNDLYSDLKNPDPMIMNSYSLITAVQILNGMNEDSRFSNLSQDLAVWDAQVFDKISAYPAYFSDTNQVIGSLREFQANRSYVYKLFRRVPQKWQGAMSQGNVGNLSSSLVTFLLNNADSLNFSDQQKFNFVIAVGHQAQNNSNWGMGATGIKASAGAYLTQRLHRASNENLSVILSQLNWQEAFAKNAAGTEFIFAIHQVSQDIKQANGSQAALMQNTNFNQDQARLMIYLQNQTLKPFVYKDYLLGVPVELRSLNTDIGFARGIRVPAELQQAINAYFN